MLFGFFFMKIAWYWTRMSVSEEISRSIQFSVEKNYVYFGAYGSKGTRYLIFILIQKGTVFITYNDKKKQYISPSSFSVYTVLNASKRTCYSVHFNFRLLSISRSLWDRGRTSRNQEFEFSKVRNFSCWSTGFKISLTGCYG